jgi:hypothetical protein
MKKTFEVVVDTPPELYGSEETRAVVKNKSEWLFAVDDIEVLIPAGFKFELFFQRKKK